MKEKYNMWVEKFVPTKTVKSGQRHKLPWTSYKSVKRAKHAKRAAKVKAKKSDPNVHNLQFDQAKKNAENALYKAKLDYESSLVNKIKTEPKMFYNYARHLIPGLRQPLKYWRRTASRLQKTVRKQKF